MAAVITLTAKGPQGVGKTLLLDAIRDFLSADEAKAPESLRLFRKAYGANVVHLTERQES